MRKVKLQLPTNEWQDIVTKYAPDDNRFVDQNAFITGTKNIDTESDGTIRKMKGGTQFVTVPASPKDTHEVIFSDGIRHLLEVDSGTLRFTAGATAMTDVTSGFSSVGNFEFATNRDRAYFGNGINTNQVYDKIASYGGVGYSVPQTKDMGAQVPSTAPTATIVVGAGVPVGGHTYKITFLYYGFEESNGSSASNLVTIIGGPNEQVDLSAIPIGGYGVTDRKIYRDNNDGVYVLVGTLSDNTTTIFSDNAAGGTTPIPTDNGFVPTFGLIKLFLDRLWFAQISGEPFTLYFSEAGLPDIVESTNFIQCNPEDPITSIFVYRGRLVIFNRNSMGQILGTNRDTFRYDSIEDTIGCVDTRSVQEIVLNGVPILIWLSTKGIYGFNGSSIFYLSDKIENLINVNIRQAVVQKNQKVDTTNDDFNAGTPSEGIDIAGGSVSVRGYVDGTAVIGNNPRRTWNDTDDWDNGDSLDNIATIEQSNKLTIVDDNSQEPATEGVKNDAMIASGIGVTLQESTDFIGESGSTSIQTISTPNVTAVAWKFIPPRTGTFDGFSMEAQGSGGGIIGATVFYTVRIFNDNLGVPGSTLATSALQSTTVTGAFGIFSIAVNNISVGNPILVAGTKYWVGIVVNSGVLNNFNSAPFPTTGINAFVLSGGFWIVPTVISTFTGTILLNYNFTSAPIAAAGTWTSDIIDTKSITADPTDLTFTASYPANTGSMTTLEGGDALDFLGNIIVEESQVLNDVTGTNTITLGARRFYQIKLTLTTSDDRDVPIVSTAVVFAFSTTAEWISDPVDTTADSTIYNLLNTTFNTPGSSSVVTEIRTATTLGGLPAAPFVAFGSVVVRQFAQVRLTLTKDGANLPDVSALTLTWTIVSNIISAAIDALVTPAGWDIFQTDFVLNGGITAFDMRAASTSPGLPGATFFTVTNGNYPPVALPIEQFVQWRVTITATDGNVPVVSSVTVAWLLEELAGVRAASIFHDKNYYISLAELGNEENTIIVQLDAKGKWRIKRGLGVSTFSFFYDNPYFGSSTSGVIGRFLEGFTDLGTDIEVDVRTRALDFSEQFFNASEFEKLPQQFLLEGRGTGATYDISYSLDNGVTYTPMVDITTGLTTFTTTDDDKLFSRVFSIDTEVNGLEGARTISYKVHTDDEFDVKVHRMKPTVFITTKEPIITG